MSYNKINYRYPKDSDRLRHLISFVDRIGHYCYHNRIVNNIQLDNVNSLCFVQLAHIGDIILMLPTINALKILSNKKVSIAINPLNNDLAKHLSFVDDIFIINHPFFCRGRQITNYFRFLQDFRKIKADVVFELRGDLKIIPFLKILSSYKFIIGYNTGGGGFLLDKVINYHFAEHITKSYEGIIDLFNLNNNDILTYWDVNLIPTKPISTKFDDYVCVNVGVGASSKDWEWRKFINLIKLISKKYKVVVLGREHKGKAKFYRDGLENNKRIEVLINKTSMTESSYIIKNASYFIGLDSGFTHISSLLGVKTLAIYSGTNNSNQWRPIELFANQVLIIKKYVECGNCGKPICPDNICMKQITISEVYNNIMEHIN